jgi:transcriptional regulator with XRE-family HTH domain
VIELTKILPKIEKLKKTRILKGLSLQGLAKLSTTLHASTLSRIENGLCTTVSPKTSKLICNVLGVAFDEVFEIVNTEKQAV